MKQAFLLCCAAACITAFSISPRGTHAHIYPSVTSESADTIPPGKDTTRNKMYDKDSAHQYDSNRNMNVDTGSNNNNPPTRDSLINR